MDYRNITHVLCLVVTVGTLSVECLVGLIPPQHKKKHEIRPTESYHSPDSLTYKHSKVDTVCYLPELFRCSSILVRRSVWMEGSPCTRINAFSHCSASALSREGRHNYFNGITQMRKLTQPFYKQHGCPSINSHINQTHLRHSQSKDSHTNDCCITTLLRCSVQIFLDSNRTPRPSKCQLLSGYKQCLSSSSPSCQWKSFMDKFPDVAHFSLKCPSKK